MCCGIIQVGFLFARKNTNKVNKPKLMKHNLPQLYMKLSLTVYPMMLTKMFFFLFFLKAVKLHVCSNLQHFSGCCVLCDGRLKKTSVRISSVIVGMRLSCFELPVFA